MDAETYNAAHPAASNESSTHQAGSPGETKSIKAAAGIVTFNPDIELLGRNIASIVDQVGAVYVFDNGSNNAAEVKYELRRFAQDITLVMSPENVGIAAALNVNSKLATANGFEWIVTLDQDSVAPKGMVANLEAQMIEGIAMATPYIVDRNKMTEADFCSLTLPPVEDYQRAAAKGAITSGALLRLSALETVGGFDEQFFIDYVDYDLNRRLLSTNLRIIRVNTTFLEHEVGAARPTRLFTPRRQIDGSWRMERFYSFGHSEFRCYYKARNRVLYSRKHWRKVGFANEGVFQVPQQIVLTILFERDRFMKLKAFARGLRDGFREPLEQPWPSPPKEAA